MPTEAQAQESRYFKIARRLTGLGIAIVPTYPGERRALFNDWQNLATTDIKKLEEWAESGYPLIKDRQPVLHRVTPDHNLVCVAKSRGVQCWDIDDYAACL